MGKSRQQLIQEYEDAKLALLLDEYAEIYGKVSADLYEKDVADGKTIAVSEQDQETQLNEILRRAEADERKETRKGTHFKGAVRKITTVAAAIAIVFLMMVSVQAAGIDVFGAIGKWTNNLFHFESQSSMMESGQNNNVKDQSLPPKDEIRKTLVLYGFPIELAPSWLPEGFFLKNISFPNNLEYEGVCFYLENPSGDWLMIQIDTATTVSGFFDEWVEKDPESVETLVVQNKQFYLFQNDSIWTGTYQSKAERISIICSYGKDDLVHIIQQIGEE